MLLQFRVLRDGFHATRSIGAIYKDEGDGWLIHTGETLRKGTWDRIPDRGGFVAPAQNIAHLAPALQDAVRAVYRAGLEPDIESFREAKLQPGEYHPRVWRGLFDSSEPFESLSVDPSELYGPTFVQSVTSAVSLFDALVDVFKVIEPNDTNANAFGHRIRELLILACTEVETNLRSVYLANHPPLDISFRTSTREYVLLQEPMGLSQWELRLRDHPACEALVPFGSWEADKPTQSLCWYDAYNSVKHDREQHFSRAAFRRLLEAMAGLHAVLVAQWGPEVFSFWGHNYRSPFSLSKSAAWSPGELYLAPLPGSSAGWVSVPLNKGR